MTRALAPVGRGPGRLERLAAPLAALALLAAGCSLLPGALKPGRKAPAQASAQEKAFRVQDYFPLTARSHWHYRIRELRKRLDYENRVRVFGEREIPSLGRKAIQVEERYGATGGGVLLLEEQEPVVYFLENGYLNRIFLTMQGGKLIAASGSGDSRFLPEKILPGSGWDSSSETFRVGTELGFKISHTHKISIDPNPIKVPAGKFASCVRIDTYTTNGPGSGRGDAELTFYYSDWYAAGVGLVRTQQFDDQKRTLERTRIELLEYSVEPAEEAHQDGTP